VSDSAVRISAADAILLADIGGTNARFALMTDGLGAIRHLAVADFAAAKDAVATFLREEGAGVRVAGAVLAVAAPVEGERCRFTNSPWVIDAAELRAVFGMARVELVNDFEAVAWSLPRLTADDLRPVGGGAAVPGGPMVVLGPGTGLGVAALVSTPSGFVVVPTEAGHTTLAATTDREAAIIAELRRRFGHVSTERVLSGPGIEALHTTIATLDGVVVPPRGAAGRAGRLPGLPRRRRRTLRHPGQRRRRSRADLSGARRRPRRRRDRAAARRPLRHVGVPRPLRAEGPLHRLSGRYSDQRDRPPGRRLPGAAGDRGPAEGVKRVLTLWIR
jgi:glucokinase